MSSIFTAYSWNLLRARGAPPSTIDIVTNPTTTLGRYANALRIRFFGVLAPGDTITWDITEHGNLPQGWYFLGQRGGITNINQSDLETSFSYLIMTGYAGDFSSRPADIGANFDITALLNGANSWSAPTLTFTVGST